LPGAGEDAAGAQGDHEPRRARAGDRLTVARIDLTVAPHQRAVEVEREQAGHRVRRPAASASRSSPRGAAAPERPPGPPPVAQPLFFLSGSEGSTPGVKIPPVLAPEPAAPPPAPAPPAPAPPAPPA